MSEQPSTERGNALLQLVVESRLRAESDRMAVGHSPDSQARSRAMLDLGGWIDRLKAAEDAQPREPASDQSPIANVIVKDGEGVAVCMYAPGLPDGSHDLYCAPQPREPAVKRPSVDDVIAALTKRAIALPMGATAGQHLCDCSTYNAYKWAISEICTAYSELRDVMDPKQPETKAACSCDYLGRGPHEPGCPALNGKAKP